MLNLDRIIEEYNHYAKKSIKFKEYQLELDKFRNKYRLSNIKNFDQQDKIYPIYGDREESFLREICTESLMGTKVGAIFSNFPKFFKKQGSLDNFIFFLKELLKIDKNDFYNSFYNIIINNNHFITLSMLKTALIQIISCYFPDYFFPIYKIKGILYALKEYGVDITKFNLNNNNTFGNKIFNLNKKLRELKLNNAITKEWDNVVFTHFLFSCFPLNRVKIIRNLGFKFLERNEQFVVALFSKLHQKLGYRRIIRIKTEFPDAEVEDDKGNIKNIEFEYDLIKFKSHIKKEDKNYHKKCDTIICWSDNSKPKLRNIIKDAGIVVIKLEDITNPKSELYSKIFD